MEKNIRGIDELTVAASDYFENRVLLRPCVVQKYQHEWQKLKYLCLRSTFMNILLRLLNGTFK